MVGKYHARFLTQNRKKSVWPAGPRKTREKENKKRKGKIKMNFMELFIFDVVFISCGLFVFSCFAALYFWIEARKEDREMKKAGIVV